LILSGPPPILCWGPAALHLGRLASTAGDLDAAMAHLEEARAQASSMGITHQLHVNTAYAELLAKLGRDAEAAEVARDVRERANALGMKPLVERAAAVLERVT
jgi:hypothetical protein